jgi:hypothetical protein
MTALRRFLGRHRALAALIVAMALCIKALVPAGMMVGGDVRHLTVEICTDGAGSHVLRDITVPAKQGGTGHDGAGNAAKGHDICPYSTLAFAGLPGTDPLLLGAALAFALLLALAPLLPVSGRIIPRLRPPLRAPPLPA